MVAMLGSIIPAPLAIPTTLAPPFNVRLLNLGYRSVVMIALAAVKASPSPSAISATAAGTTSLASSSAGSLHPITPVLLGRTLRPPPGRSRQVATASQTVSEAAWPSSAEQTLETLLLMTRAWRGIPEERRDRPTLMGAPGYLFLVKTAPQLSVGSSSATTVPKIFRPPIAGASTGTNVPGADPHRNPRGRDARAWRYVSYSSLSRKVGRVESVSAEETRRDEDEDADIMQPALLPP
mmetsp:Transcript_29360/g.67436  ORF Transcript_29360/g.67436 Transcript_29360/m.67436 type:complete len:237 (-) Transcript_29360:250-960(-)